MKKNTTLVMAALVVVVALLVPAVPAQAATGTTNVSVSINPLIILYYYSNASVDLSSADLATVFGLASADSSVATATMGTPTVVPAAGSATVTPGTALTSTPPASTSANIVLLNNWGVRSIGNGTTNTQVAVAVGTSTLTRAGGGTMTIGSVGTRLSGGGAFGANVNWAPLGLGNVQYGDVQVPINFTGGTLAGTYSGGTYVITASSL